MGLLHTVKEHLKRHPRGLQDNTSTRVKPSPNHSLCLSTAGISWQRGGVCFLSRSILPVWWGVVFVEELRVSHEVVSSQSRFRQLSQTCENINNL